MDGPAGRPASTTASEAAALQVEDIDFLRRTLTVTRQVQRGGQGPVEIRPPKYCSERDLYLAPGLVDLLAAHVTAYCPDVGWLFTGEIRQLPHQNTVGYRWRTTTAATGIDGLRLHDLRHFYARV